jgi:Uma2 family endonuclease
MTVAAEPKLLTIDEFMALPDSSGLELVEGVPTERKLMGGLADYVAIQVAIELGLFCRRTGAGHVFGSETTYRCFGHPNTGRRGDVSFVRAGRFPNERIPEGVIDIPADLMVEVISPNDTAYNVEAKVALYLRNGFDEIWLVYPNIRTVHVYRRGEPIRVLDDQQTLRGQGPLQGFETPIARFFPPSAPQPQD